MKYWLAEQPIEVDTERINIKMYQNSQMVVFELKPRVRSSDGATFTGNRLAVNLYYLKTLPADQREALESIFAEITEAVAVRSG